MTALGRFAARRRSEARACFFGRQAGELGDDGFTLVELLVTMLVLSIVLTLSGLLIVAFNQNSANIINTTKGVDQADIAEQNVVQYLRGVSQVLATDNAAGTQVAPSPTEFDATVTEGFDTTTYLANCTNVDLLWLAPTQKSADAQLEVVFGTSAAGPANGAASPPEPFSKVTPSSAIPTAFNPASSCAPSGTSRTVSTYFGLNTQSHPVFTYYKSTPTGLSALAIQNPVPSCAVSEISAVGVSVTFLAGPQQPKSGGLGVQSTTLQTIVYLRAAATSSTSSTTTTTSTACPE